MGTMAVTINEATTADCPLMTFTMTGTKDKAALEALSTEIQAWSDGYNFNMSQTWSATFFTTAAADEALELAFGRGATLTAAENGAYSYGLVWANDAANNNVDVTSTRMAGYYLPAASVTANLDQATNASKVNIYWDSATSAIVPKYGWAASPPFTGTEDAKQDSVITGGFYMPKEDKKAENETTATGDRFNKKAKVSFFCGAGTPTATAGTDIEVTLGAATLAAAGSIALAAALSF